MTPKMRFHLISQFREQNPQWPVKALCRIVGVSRSGYTLFCKRQKPGFQKPGFQKPGFQKPGFQKPGFQKPGLLVRPSQSQRSSHHSDNALLLHIRAAYRRGRGYSGSPRIYDDLREHGIRTSRKRIARLMQQNGLVGRSRARRRVVTTDSGHRLPIAQNLLARRFTPEEVGRPNRFWCGDITYLPTSEGWLYLAMVKDLFSRRIVGWALGETMEASLVEAAWKRALQTRGFAPHQGPELYHSDRGSQYAGLLFRNLLATSNTQASMSGAGECLDNAVAESFFGTLKAELLGDQPGRCFASKRQTWELVADYIDNFYNLVRRHSALGYKSPIAVEMAHRIK